MWNTLLKISTSWKRTVIHSVIHSKLKEERKKLSPYNKTLSLKSKSSFPLSYKLDTFMLPWTLLLFSPFPLSSPNVSSLLVYLRFDPSFC